MVAFDPLEATALICVFEDAVMQLNILSTLEGDKGRRGAARAVPDEADLGMSDRIRRQRARMKMLFERLMGRLIVSGDIGTLLESELGRRRDATGDDDAEDAMEKEAAQAAEARRSLKAVQEEVARTTETIAQQEVEIGRLKDEERLEVNVSLAKQHVTKSWARARMQFLQRTHCVQDDSTRRQIQETHDQRRREIRVHSDVIKFLNLEVEDLQKQTKSWEEQYRTQSAQWEVTLKRLRAEKEQHAARLRSITAELARQREFCAEVLRIRDRKRLAAESQERQHKAATRIQAWWRGHMVRRGFAFRKRQKLKHKQRSLNK